MTIQHSAASYALEQPANPSGSLLVGRIIALQENGNPLVAFDESSTKEPVEALTTVPLDASSVGKEVAVSFAQNQGGVAIVMGVIRRLIDDVIHTAAVEPAAPSSRETVKPEVLVNGNKLELSAAEEITLRCGDASITLNKQGKILLKGEHMLNRLSGAFKVKSGMVELN